MSRGRGEQDCIRLIAERERGEKERERQRDRDRKERIKKKNQTDILFLECPIA